MPLFQAYAIASLVKPICDAAMRRWIFFCTERGRIYYVAGNFFVIYLAADKFARQTDTLNNRRQGAQQKREAQRYSLFGELEFWFSSIKVVAILALIALGIFMVVTGFTSPSGTVTTVSNLWDHGGFFPKGIFGFYAGFQIAIYAFVGIELLGTGSCRVVLRVIPHGFNGLHRSLRDSSGMKKALKSALWLTSELLGIC